LLDTPPDVVLQCAGACFKSNSTVTVCTQATGAADGGTPDVPDGASDAASDVACVGYAPYDPVGGSDCYGLQGLPCCDPVGDCVGVNVPYPPGGNTTVPSGTCSCILPDGGHGQFGQPDPVGPGTWSCTRLP
jgi:hypothetical protein